MANIDVQIASSNDHIPANEKFLLWFKHCLPENKMHSEVSLRIVEVSEIQMLNLQYRGKDKPTNVLSFECGLPDEIGVPLLGDIVICADVVEREAGDYNKPLEDYWAHMFIHGTLHLLGYDHVQESDAHIMEGKEKQILTRLGYAEPYTPN